MNALAIVVVFMPRYRLVIEVSRIPLSRRFLCSLLFSVRLFYSASLCTMIVEIGSDLEAREEGFGAYQIFMLDAASSIATGPIRDDCSPWVVHPIQVLIICTIQVHSEFCNDELLLQFAPHILKAVNTA